MLGRGELCFSFPLPDRKLEKKTHEQLFAHPEPCSQNVYGYHEARHDYTDKFGNKTLV